MVGESPSVMSPSSSKWVVTFSNDRISFSYLADCQLAISEVADILVLSYQNDAGEVRF